MPPEETGNGLSHFFYMALAHRQHGPIVHNHRCAFHFSDMVKVNHVASLNRQELLSAKLLFYLSQRLSDRHLLPRQNQTRVFLFFIDIENVAHRHLHDLARCFHHVTLLHLPGKQPDPIRNRHG